MIYDKIYLPHNKQETHFNNEGKNNEEANDTVQRPNSGTLPLYSILHLRIMLAITILIHYMALEWK